MQYYFFKKDYNELENKIYKKQEELKKVGREIGESCEESSETWHDNFGFEEGARQQKIIMKELEELCRLRNNAIIFQVSNQNEKADIGKYIEIKDTATQEVKNFFISSYIVLNRTYKNEISYNSPLGSKLIGLKIGEQAELAINNKIVKYKVINIKHEF